MDDNLLIEMVQKHKLIYDKSDMLFKNKMARNNAWASISRELGQSIEDCQQRWNVLRTRYNTELRSIKACPSGSESAYKKKWYLLDAMRFLDKHLIKKKTKSNYYSEKIPEMKEYEYLEETKRDLNNFKCIFEESLQSEVMIKDEIDQSTTNEQKYNTEDSITIDSRIEAQHETVRRGIKRSSETSLNNSIETAVDCITTYFKSKEKNTDIENADMCFAKTIYYYLAEIHNSKRKLQIKKAILDIFIESNSNSDI